MKVSTTIIAGIAVVIAGIGVYLWLKKRKPQSPSSGAINIKSASQKSASQKSTSQNINIGASSQSAQAAYYQAASSYGNQPATVSPVNTELMGLDKVQSYIQNGVFYAGGHD